MNGNKTDGMQEIWICYGKNSKGTAFCSTRNIRGDRIREAAAKALGTTVFDEAVFASRVDKIVAPGDDTLEFHFRDGTVVSVPVETYKPNQQSVSDPHKPFPGYVWTKQGYQIVPEEADMVKLVFRLYFEGQSINVICREVADAGYRSFRGKVSSRFITRMLDDERYTGRRTLAARYSGTGREELLLNDHEAIISDELFEQVRAQRKARRDKWNQGRHATPDRVEEGDK